MESQGVSGVHTTSSSTLALALATSLAAGSASTTNEQGEATSTAVVCQTTEGCCDVVVMLFRLKGAILVHMDPRVIVLTFASYYTVVASRASVNNATISGEAG